MTGKFTENHVEQSCLDWLEELDYSIFHAPDISPDGSNPERAAYDVVIFQERLLEALRRINPHFSEDAFEHVLRRLQQTETPSLVEENYRIHKMTVDGVDVEVTRADGSVDWTPGIRAFCAHWSHAPMLQQTFDTLESEFARDREAYKLALNACREVEPKEEYVA